MQFSIGTQCKTDKMLAVDDDEYFPLLDNTRTNMTISKIVEVESRRRSYSGCEHVKSCRLHEKISTAVRET